MKSTQAIKKDIEKTAAAIKADEATIETLLNKPAKAAAIEDHNMDLYKALNDEARANEAQALELSEAVYINKITLKILNENMKAAAVAEVLPELKKVLTKYDGKPCGPKTYEKIRDALKASTGFYIGIHGQDITIYNAAVYYNSDARIYTGWKTPLIDDDNIIQAATLENITSPHKYENNPAAAAKKLIKLYKKAREAYKTAEAALSAYNDAAPEGLHKHISNGGYLPPTINTTL